MTKKIIAISCALVMLVLVFAACQKKPQTTTINGEEYVLVTDAEGNTVMSSDGMLKAYVLDEKGYIVTNQDGSNAEKLVSLPNNTIIGDQTVSTDEYSLTMPKGWTATDAGQFTKDKTDGKCFVLLGLEYDLEANQTTFAEFVQNYRASEELTEAEFKKNRPGLQIDTTYEDTTLGGHQASITSTKITDETGKLIHYALIYRYEYNGQVYRLNYACIDGVGYDENFDFVSYVNENYVIK